MLNQASQQTKILEMPEARARLAEGDIKIVGALFEISTGEVKFLE
jgi:carbonic anhydrase